MSELPKGSGLVAGFVTAGHAVLFEDVEANRCDVCASILPSDGALATEGSSDAHSERDDRDERDDSYNITGHGLLVWSRGEERRYQEPPLCAACAAAIGVSALQRWETEEDEG